MDLFFKKYLSTLGEEDAIRMICKKFKNIKKLYKAGDKAYLDEAKSLAQILIDLADSLS